jgi:hypothetical protein
MTRRHAGQFVADVEFTPKEAIWLATIVLKKVANDEKKIHLYLQKYAKVGFDGIVFVRSRGV